MSSTFEPESTLAILKSSSAVPEKKKKEFEKNWATATKDRVDAWLKHRGPGTKHNQAIVAQLQWESHVVEYVGFIYKLTKCHGNAKKDVLSPKLPKDVPLLGPRFVPPTYFHLRKRQQAPVIQPITTYLKPLNIVHPLYYDIAKCPQCGSKDVRWDGWTTSGHRNIHGLKEEETALGYQLICKECENRFSHTKGKEGADNGSFCFATTSPAFWEKWRHWEIPSHIPYFLSRSGVTNNLFDLIMEMRPSSTSMGLFEHIKQLHLLTYKKRELEYLQNLQCRRVTLFRTDPLIPFSAPDSVDGYSDNCISADTITELYLGFSNRTRREESQMYLKTLTAKCLSLDNTFKAAGKATVVDKQKAHTKFMKGGILNVINEHAEIVGWRFCLSASPNETTAFLEGFMRRCDILQVPPPDMVVVDNCCQTRNAIERAMPAVHVTLDVYHFLRRYLHVILNGTKNPHHSEVARDITTSIIKTKAGKGTPATYWNKEEQINNIQNAFDKWAKMGGVWSAAASKVHQEQMRHVQKGCLTRTREDIAADGSRIEASHKGWNSLQRSFASGLETFTALAHDFVLRRNVRIASSRAGAPLFVKSTNGSHHVHLTHHVAVLWNQILSMEKQPNSKLHPLPEMPVIHSQELFGLTESKHFESFGGFFEVSKDGPETLQDTCVPFEDDLDHVLDVFLQDLNIDPGLRSMPLKSMSDPSVGLQVNTNDQLIEHMQGGPTQSGNTNMVISTSKRKAGPVEKTDEPLAKRTCVDTVALAPIANQQSTTLTQYFNFTKLGTTASLVDQLSERLKLPDGHALTRSQHLFAVLSHIDPRSLLIKLDNEFHLFMEMRAKYQWASFTMTSAKWVQATHNYNGQLESLNTQSSQVTVKKNPRALLDKLGEIEAMITNRIMTGNYTSTRSNTDTFWKRHCHAVPIIREDPGVMKSRKPAMCTRCHTIMHPGGRRAKGNHKRDFCSDGVRVSMTDDSVPDWPQPLGIFEEGKVFHPMVFLQTLRDVYEVAVVQRSDGGDLAMEYHAFLKMVQARTKTAPDGSILFKLFKQHDLHDTTPVELLIEDQAEGATYLRLDCLRNDVSGD